jgi:hypothetical protein
MNFLQPTSLWQELLCRATANRQKKQRATSLHHKGPDADGSHVA